MQTTCEFVYLVTFIYPVLCFYDLDFDQMTLVHKHDLDILKMYVRIKTTFLGRCL